MNKKRLSLAIVSLHPSNYQAGIWKELSNIDSIDSVVYYLSDIGVKEVFDPEFGTMRKWDNMEILENYKYKFVANYAKITTGYGFLSRINPSIVALIFNRYDAILLHGYDTISMWLAFMTAWATGTAIIWRGEVVKRGVITTPPLKRAIKKYLLKFLFKRCSRVLYSCSGNKEYLRHYGVPEHKLFLIPCAVDNEYFRLQKSNYLSNYGDIRNELNISENDYVIVFSARMTVRKRPMDLLISLEKASENNIMALFIGSAPDMNLLESYVNERGIRAKFIGYKTQNEISKYYTIADAGVILSDYDPSPKSLNEMMNFSIPIIVTDVTGTSRDLVKHKENGFIVKVDDTDTIAKYIKFLCNNRDISKKMGEKSLEIVSEWTFKRDAQAIESAVHSVAKE
jgi:glycosyltransferase involved in cell wall biosynthesis